MRACLVISVRAPQRRSVIAIEHNSAACTSNFFCQGVYVPSHGVVHRQTDAAKVDDLNRGGDAFPIVRSGRCRVETACEPGPISHAARARTEAGFKKVHPEIIPKRANMLCANPQFAQMSPGCF